MKKYKQISTTISCKNDEELVERVNKLNSVGDMPMTINPTIPNITNTDQWYVVNYWVLEY